MKGAILFSCIIVALSVVGVQVAQIMKPYDPAAERSDFIDRECAKPAPDGGRRQIVNVSGQRWFTPDSSTTASKMGYAHCPQN